MNNKAKKLPISAQSLLEKFPHLKKSKPNKGELVDIACPKCGNRNKFDVVCDVKVTFSDEKFDPIIKRSELTVKDKSVCFCVECGYEGWMYKFRFPFLEDMIKKNEQQNQS